jgi:hypothetical protein
MSRAIDLLRAYQQRQRDSSTTTSDEERCLGFFTGEGEQTLDALAACYSTEAEPDEDKLYRLLAEHCGLPRRPDADRYYADDQDGEYAEIAAALGIRRPASLEPR